MTTALPDGLRIYAIGDIHGRFDRLVELYDLIRRDLAESRPQRTVEIFLGDYFDRGPQSSDVVEWLIAGVAATDARICLLGNHEDILLGALAHPDGIVIWLHNGGDAALASYGVDVANFDGRAGLAALRDAFLQAFPPRHRAFVETLPRMAEFDPYLFVHAGVRPGRPLNRQDPDDLVWIREPFLSSTADFGRVIVHGHTPMERPDVRPNRINIDTGAVFTGRLTCLVLEGAARRFLQTAPD
jgi:serine/threonine protein phosphatase 1